MYNLRYYSTLQSDIQFTIHDLRLTTVSLQSDSRRVYSTFFFQCDLGFIDAQIHSFFLEKKQNRAERKKYCKRAFTIDYDSRFTIYDLRLTTVSLQSDSRLTTIHDITVRFMLFN